MKDKAKPLKEPTLEQKLDEKVFEQLLKYNPQTKNLWDIVGVFEYERGRLRLEVAQYEDDIKNAKETLKGLREDIKKAQDLLELLQNDIAKLPPLNLPEEEGLRALSLKVMELELENSKLKVELRDLKGESELEEILASLKNSKNA